MTLDEELAIPMYQLTIVYGLDEEGNPLSMAEYANLINPEESVPTHHKFGLAGEATTFAMSDVFSFHTEED